MIYLQSKRAVMNEEEQFIFDYMLGRANLEAALSGQLPESERDDKLSFAAQCFKKALDSGYVPTEEEKESEFDCRVKLALLLVHFNYRGNADISQKGLSETGLERAVKELEEALNIDASLEGQLLSDRRLAADVLLCLDSLWLAQSSHLYKRLGALTALQYLQNKWKSLEHLGSINLPGVCSMLFQYWTEIGNPGIGEDWLRRAADGETFEDVAKGTRFCSASSQYKKIAQEMLAQL